MRIFLSYRRDDTAGHVGRLADRLVARFGPRAVFRDLDSIAPGRDFTRAIDEAIRASDAVLVVIGREWLAAGPDGRSRLQNDGDYVRAEIAAALARDIQVIPVLVDRAAMPAPADLPEPIRALANRNALEVTDSRWDYDVGRLVDALDPDFPERLSGVLSAPARGGGPSRPRRRRGLVGAGVAAAAVVLVVVLSYLGDDAGGPGGGPGGDTTGDPTADAVAGRWSGAVADGQGGSVRITFDIWSGCALGDPCGTVEARVSSTEACFGDITFLAISGSTHEFDVVQFRSGSSSWCTPGAGEFLTPQGDALRYTTDYGPSGTLTRS